MESPEIIKLAQTYLNITPKDEQLEAISSYFNKGQDTMFVAPTGYGKSILFLLAPFLYDVDTELYTCNSNTQEPVLTEDRPRHVKKLFSNEARAAHSQFLIVMPLTSMIEDAMLNIKKNLPQLSSVHLSAATSHMCKAAVLIFTSPESLIDGTGRRVLQGGINIKAVFIDEFHIVDQWGSESGKAGAFRDAYGRLDILRSFLTNVPIVCMSATATDITINNVKESLKLRTPTVIKVSINKSNLIYHTVKVTGSVLSDFKWLCQLINTSSDIELPRVLIFFTNINTLVDAYQYVTLNTHQPVGTSTATVVMYHLITDQAIKSRVLSDLGNPTGCVKVSLCSSSLSMGLNFSRIEYVIHYGVPTTASAFLQESGRACRETGVLGNSLLLTYPRMTAGRKVDEAMKAFGKAEVCLRDTLLNKFGCSKPPEQDPCCDVCDPQVSCQLKALILDSYDTSITDSFSDSLSIASVGDIDTVLDLECD